MTRYLNQLHENTAPVSGDYVLTYDASATAGDEDRWANISRFAILANANTFTAAQIIAPATTGANGLTSNMPTSTTGLALIGQYNSVNRQYAQITATINQYAILDFDNGSSDGPHIYCGRNSNVSTPAAGYAYLMNRAGTGYAVWPDASGNLRIGTSTPTNANDGTGTVVGTQTSMAEAKNISEQLPSWRESFAAILDAARTLRAWTYKSGAFGGELFPCGIVTDYAPRYGMDRDSEHPHGKSLNVAVAIGDLMASIALLHDRILALEAPGG